MLKYLIFFVILYFIFFNKTKEGFMNYDQRRRYFICKYSGNPYSADCRNFFDEIRQIKNHIINNPIGYVYKKGVRRPLSAWYDRDLRKYYYYVIDYSGKRPKKNDFIMHSIDNNGRQLYEDDVVEVPSKGKMKIKLYDDVFSPYYNTTFLNDSFYRPKIHPRFGGLNRRFYGYNSMWKTVGYVTSEKGDFYKLYEREHPRNNFRYRIQLYPGFFIDAQSPNATSTSRKDDKYRFRDRLYQGDKLKVDTMDKKFKVHRYKYDDIF